MLLRPGRAALLLSALALTAAYTPGRRLSSCVRTASLHSHRKRALLHANLPDGIEPVEGLSSLLREADIVEPETVVELSAGFCNWVYRVDLPGQAGASASSVLGKVFSPLAKMRIAAPDRGRGDELAGEAGLGPRVRFRSEDGLITEFVRGSDLSERDIHARTPWLLRRIASKLAGLHSLALPHPTADGVGTGSPADGEAKPAVKPPVVLWQFLDSMIAHVAEQPQTVPEGMCLQEVADEVARMRTRFDELGLPVVFGHGDLKPSNVMTLRPHTAETGPRLSTGVCFIDFELAGAHYRGYDLFKLFRTSGEMSHLALRDFLRCYARCLAPPGSPARGARADARSALELDELLAETYAAEPLTWLEAAIFFLFACAEYPAEAERWAPLAEQRWQRYLVSAHLVDDDGEATLALARARAANRVLQAEGARA